MYCLTPKVPIPEDQVRGGKSVALAYGFKLDGVQSVRNLTDLSYEDHRVFEVFADPEFIEFEEGQKVHQQKNGLLFIEVSRVKLYCEVCWR